MVRCIIQAYHTAWRFRKNRKSITKKTQNTCQAGVEFCGQQMFRQLFQGIKIHVSPLVETSKEAMHGKES